MKTSYLMLMGLASLFLVPCVRADALDDAHRAFAGGQYAQAASGYQSVLVQNGCSAPVLFDLGNSFYREGDFARAILAYKRAQWLAPNDPDIAMNLQAAQKQAGLSVVEPPLSEKFSSYFSASGWAWAACGAWTLFCLSLLARTAWPQLRPLFSLSGAASALVVLTAIAAMVISSGELHQAVVVDKKATAVISPFPAAQTVFAPAAGETVTVHEVYHDYLRVKDAAGHTGWINQAQVESIIPKPSKS